MVQNQIKWTQKKPNQTKRPEGTPFKIVYMRKNNETRKNNEK